MIAAPFAQEEEPVKNEKKTTNQIPIPREASLLQKETTIAARFPISAEPTLGAN